MDDTGMTIPKRDALGRVGDSHGLREALPDKFERSGLKVAVSTRTAGILHVTENLDLEPVNGRHCPALHHVNR
jgi:hypothetical protein